MEYRYKDAGWRGPFSGIIGGAWLIGIIIYLAFFASEFHPYEKNIAIILLSLLILIIILGGIWAVWAIRRIPREGRKVLMIRGLKSRILVTIAFPLLSIVFLIYYFWFYDFTIWQHIAIVLVILILHGLVLGFIWSSWKKSFGDNFEERMENMGKEIGKNIEKEFSKKEKED